MNNERKCCEKCRVLGRSCNCEQCVKMFGIRNDDSCSNPSCPCHTEEAPKEERGRRFKEEIVRDLTEEAPKECGCECHEINEQYEHCSRCKPNEPAPKEVCGAIIEYALGMNRVSTRGTKYCQNPKPCPIHGKKEVICGAIVNDRGRKTGTVDVCGNPPPFPLHAPAPSTEDYKIKRKMFGIPREIYMTDEDTVPSTEEWEREFDDEFGELEEMEAYGTKKRLNDFIRQTLSHREAQVRREATMETIIWATGAASLSKEDLEIFRSHLHHQRPNMIKYISLFQLSVASPFLVIGSFLVLGKIAAGLILLTIGIAVLFME